MVDLTPNEYRAWLRHDLCAFIERCFYQLNPQTRLLMNWHIEVMAANFRPAGRGKSVV